MIVDASYDAVKRLSMIHLYFFRFTLRMRLMAYFRPELRKLLAGKSVDIEFEFIDRSVFIHFDNGKVSLCRQVENPPRVKVSFRSFSLTQNVIRSAMVGDQFWLSAMRDHRVNVSGDMSVVLWFFSLCRHLPLRMK